LRNAGLKEGCSFVFSSVPRARQEVLFRNGHADLLVPAVRLPVRDEAGVFVPLTSVRAQLISVDASRPAVHSLKELEARRDVRLVLVRGFDYGDNYQTLIAELKKQGRLSLEPDPDSIARVILSGAADATIMTAPIFSGAVQMDGRLRGLQDKLRYETLDDLPWTESGIYVSKRSLALEERTALLDLLDQVAKSGALWANIKNYEQLDALKDSVRPPSGSKLGTR
jgi:polar amino acid transport system substrate-binding protein